MTEEELRALLGPDGIVASAVPALLRAAPAYMVFAQRTDARVEAGAWARHADQFFATRLGLSADKRYERDAPTEDLARVVIAPRDDGERTVATSAGDAGARVCFGRLRTREDLTLAEDADARKGNTGLALLAKRCPSVWRVIVEGEPDRVALLVAAILASVVLGPILSPDGDELFGVRTARNKLERVSGPYR